MPEEPKIVTRILNCIPSRDTEKDWGFANAIDSGTIGSPAAIPASVDLRADWWKIGDQDETGSCVGWAVADSVIKWHFVKVDRIKKTDHLAVRFLWMASKEHDEFVSQPTTFIEQEGTSIKSALDIARKYGNIKDAMLPFLRAVLYPGDTKTFYAIAANLRIASYFNLGTNQDNWRTWLATNGPIVTRLKC